MREKGGALAGLLHWRSYFPYFKRNLISLFRSLASRPEPSPIERKRKVRERRERESVRNFSKMYRRPL